ncbi:PREDICTED: carcinoembryonic antigen-related cell adhesion molecule 1-like isoform X2 [Condylura cristata]|uniref:carcinoembryonic antigen-related cell adhesion molecule 1-like isoform X2 n=1 Tax=Condylura cristata TaxID=143302 RepID=UPI000643B6B7|nr:PREDICTED: carcinoembryonic antigen-related cell adhesion molecule 1-like isoform X2 [Condylura cristata]
METPSAHGHRGRAPWTGLLLAVLVLIFWTLPTSTQLTIEFVPPSAAEEWLPKPYIISSNPDPVEHQDHVVLTCEPEIQNTTYLWSINSQSLPDSNRLKLSMDNRTLVLLRVTRADTGPYVCETQNPASTRRSDPFTLNVLYGPDTPIILPLQSYYHPGKILSLTCHAYSNPPPQYSWLINGESQEFTQQRLFIPNISVSDSGVYTCLVHNTFTGLQKSTVKVIMVSESATTPSILASKTVVIENKDAVVLICLTIDTGISILWHFNNDHLWLTDRMALSWDKRILTINPVRREDAGEYQCEVLRLYVSSRSDPLTLTVITGDSSVTGLSAGAIAGIVIAVLIFQAAALGWVLFLKYGRRTRDKRGLSEHQPPAPTPDPGPSGNATFSTPNPGPAPAAVPIYQELLYRDTNIYGRINPMAEAAS